MHSGVELTFTSRRLKMQSGLPRHIESVDISDLVGLSPEALLLDPPRVLRAERAAMTARAILYSRVASDNYDVIGFRFSAATPNSGPVPLQTFGSTRRDHENLAQRRLDNETEMALEEIELLRHRSIALPSEDAHYSYRIYRTTIELVDKATDEPWTFALSAPPAMLHQIATEADAVAHLSQQFTFSLPGAHWLPTSRLIAQGKFARMQNVRQELETKLQPGRCYCFVSHRWHSPSDPDPDGTQAAFIAWQIFAHLCDAVRVAALRGLHKPRLRIQNLNAFIGAHSTGLAELLLVNVLRPTLDEDSLRHAWTEVQGVEHLVADFGVAAASGDTGLHRLRTELEQLPVIAALLERVLLWYDYSCIPQSPYTPAEQELFLAGLKNLVTMQQVAHTVVLLDEVEDYLSRAWCTLEALVADDAHAGNQLLIGAPRHATRNGKAEHDFNMLLQDRPHLVWRAILDTEVFAIQDVRHCLERLGLDVTDPNDIPIVYGMLVELRAPVKVHIDASELVTGLYPLVRLDGNRALVPEANRSYPAATGSTRTLNWTGALTARSVAPPDLVPPLVEFAPRDLQQIACHIAVVGACEGEAILFSRWIIQRRAELEEELGMVISSLSWLASDIAPVGHFSVGDLRAVPLDAGMWIVASTEARLKFCPLTGGLIDTLTASGAPCWLLSMSQPENNLVLAASRDGAKVVNIPAEGFPTLAGGAFRDDLQGLLFESGARTTSGPDTDTAKEHVWGNDAMIDPTTTSELRDQLFEAIDTRNEERLLYLVNGYSNYVIGSFNEWRRPPDAFLHSPPEQQRWAHFLMTLARLFDDNGVPDLLQSLTGGADNPMARWGDGFARADRLQQAGRYQESNDILLPILVELGTMSGPGVDKVHGAILGMLGTNFFRLGNLAEARSYTERALAECQRIGDTTGIRVYTENLSMFR